MVSIWCFFVKSSRLPKSAPQISCRSALVYRFSRYFVIRASQNHFWEARGLTIGLNRYVSFAQEVFN